MADHSPSEDQFPWSPIEVFQVNISPSYIMTPPRRGHAPDPSARAYAARKHIKTFTPAWHTTSKSIMMDYAKNLNRGIGYYNKIKSTPNIFTVAIGVFYKEKLHKGAGLLWFDKDGDEHTKRGHDIDYELLFELLYSRGFDPLKPIRKAHKEVEDKIRNVVLKQFGMESPGSREQFRGVIENIGATYKNYVTDYIKGSGKPRLAEETINTIRPMKLAANGALYEGGNKMERALVESGQLLNAINYKVWVEQSSEFRAYAEKVADMLEEQKTVERNRAAYETRQKRTAALEKARAAKKEKAKVKVKVEKKRRKKDEEAAIKMWDDLQKDKVKHAEEMVLAEYKRKSVAFAKDLLRYYRFAGKLADARKSLVAHYSDELYDEVQKLKTQENTAIGLKRSAENFFKANNETFYRTLAGVEEFLATHGVEI